MLAVLTAVIVATAGTILVGTRGSDTPGQASSGSPTTAPVSGTATPPPSEATAAAPPEPPAAAAGVVTLLAAGDIADCSRDDGEAARRTGDLLAGQPGVIAALGDLAYPNGTDENFRQCYDEVWGDLLDRTRPTPGNHDVRTGDADGYFDYMGDLAGPRPEGWYSYDLGAWHVVVLNSNCDEVDGCDPDSPQGRWLHDDLAAAGSPNILAYWHHPRFSTGYHGHAPQVDGLWRVLHEAGADVVLNGHDHDYERYEPIDPDGDPDAEGIHQFVVGTGGAELREFEQDAPSTVGFRQDTEHGVLRLDLGACGVRWRFLTVEGGTLDAGWARRTCRN